MLTLIYSSHLKYIVQIRNMTHFPIFACCSSGFPLVSPASAHFSNMAVGGLKNSKLGSKVRIWWPVIDWRSIQDVFLPRTQRTWDRLQIHHDQDKALTEQANE